MGIRFSCPNGHKLHVKEHLAGKRGVCPSCGAKVNIPPAQPAEPSAVLRTATEGRGASHQVPGTDAASQSIAISIVEPSRAPLARAANTPPNIAEPIAPATLDIVPPIVAPRSKEAVPLGSPEASSPGAGNSVPAASRYVAKRMRSRRNQTRLAIGLLVAVIILAVVLIIVLRSQSASPDPGSLVRFETSRTQHLAAVAARASKV